ncbi:hypothetical protein B0H14DRAFT_3453542 [Mycena olivaceomarginata]|nr:hypothetical protein B0H14DRAFT_3453542 [Mycena olivaceomarginata]
MHVLASSLRRQVGRVPVYPCMRETPPACARHTILTPATGPSTISARPIHTNTRNPKSASSILVFISIAHEHISSPPYAIQLRPPACHRRPSPVHTAPPHPPFIDRVCAADDGVCEEVLGGLGLRLRAAASDRSLREVLVAMVPILRHQPPSFALLLPADGARALHTRAFYLS